MRFLTAAGVLVALLHTGVVQAAELPPGAAFAEKPLPDGSTSVWGGLGFPGVVLGYRQGFPGFEAGATLGLDYARTELDLDLPFRATVLERSNLRLGVGGSVGGFLDLGATYYEPTNLPSAGLRLSVGGDLTYRVGQSLAVLGTVLVPVDLCLTERGNHRADFLLGPGVELGLGDGFTFGAQALLGPELLHPRGGQSDARLGVSVLAALGKRIF